MDTYRKTLVRNEFNNHDDAKREPTSSSGARRLRDRKARSRRKARHALRNADRRETRETR